MSETKTERNGDRRASRSSSWSRFAGQESDKQSEPSKSSARPPPTDAGHNTTHGAVHGFFQLAPYLLHPRLDPSPHLIPPVHCMAHHSQVHRPFHLHSGHLAHICPTCTRLRFPPLPFTYGQTPHRQRTSKNLELAALSELIRPPPPSNVESAASPDGSQGWTTPPLATTGPALGPSSHQGLPHIPSPHPSHTCHATTPPLTGNSRCGPWAQPTPTKGSLWNPYSRVSPGAASIFIDDFHTSAERKKLVWLPSIRPRELICLLHRAIQSAGNLGYCGVYYFPSWRKRVPGQDAQPVGRHR